MLNIKFIHLFEFKMLEYKRAGDSRNQLIIFSTDVAPEIPEGDQSPPSGCLSWISILPIQHEEMTTGRPKLSKVHARYPS